MKQRRLKKVSSLLLAGVMMLTVFPSPGNAVYAQEETEIAQPAESEETVIPPDNSGASDIGTPAEEAGRQEMPKAFAQNLSENDVIEVPAEGMVIAGGVYYGISKKWYEATNPGGKVLSLSLQIPDNVTTIYDDGFKDSWSSQKQSQRCVTNYNYDGDKTYTDKYTVVNIDFSDAASLTTINSQAAMGCSLTGVLDLSHTKLETLGKSAFNGCTGLTGVIFPATLKNIGDQSSGSVFNGCAGLQFVRTAGGNPSAVFELPETLEVIGKQSFQDCTGFPANTTVAIPASVTFVGSEAFDEAPSVTAILVQTDDASGYDGGAFKGNDYGLGKRLTVFSNSSAKNSFQPSGSNAYSNSLTYEFTLYYGNVKTEKKLWGQAVNVCRGQDGSWQTDENYTIPEASGNAPVGYTGGWIYQDAVLTNQTVLKPSGDELTLSVSYVLQEPTVRFIVDGKGLEAEGTYPKLNLSNDKPHTIGVDVSHPIQTADYADIKVKFEYEWTDVWKGGSPGPRMKEEGFGKYNLWDNPDVTNTITINGAEHERTSTGNYSKEDYGDGYYLLEIYGYSCPKSGGQWTLFYKSASTVIGSDPDRTTDTAYVFDVVTSAPAQAPNVTFTGNCVDYGYDKAEIIASVSEIDGQTNTYQWYKASKEHPSSQGEKMDGATSASLKIEKGKDAGDYYYYLEVTSRKEQNGDVVKTNFPVTFTVAKIYRQINYAFQSASDKDLPKEIQDLLPPAEPKEYGARVTPAALTSDRVEVTDGVWRFEGWSPEEIESLTEDTKFVGTWKYYPYQKIQANDLTVYEGGLGSNNSASTGDALPEPAWAGQMSGHTVTVDGKEWNVEEQGLPFTWKYLDENNNQVTSSARAGAYSLTVYPKEELKGKDVILDNQSVLELPENGLKVSAVKVREITDNDNADSLSTETFKNVYNYTSPQASAISRFSMPASDFSASALDGTFDTITGTHTDDCDASVPHAHVKEGTTFLKNGVSDMPVGSNAKIGLLWDHLLSDVLGSEEYMDKLHEKSLQAIQNGIFNAGGTIHKEFKYIDLVDMTDGNVWVGTKQNDVTIYYPYPEGVTKDSAIAVTYYDGLTRDYTIDMDRADLEQEIDRSNAHPVNNLRKTDTGILFDVPSKQFGPIEFLWQSSYTPTYEFISGTDGQELPEEVTDLLAGIEAKSYAEGASIPAPELNTKEVRTAGGVWTFQKWDAENKASADGVKFTGTWTFAKNASVVNHTPVISAEDKTLQVGDTFNDEIALNGVTAYDEEDGDLTDKIEVLNNTADTSKAGAYTVTYKVADKDGASVTKTITVIVKDTENEEPSGGPTEPDKGDKDNDGTVSKGDTPDTSVPTGDRTNVLLWSMAAAISLAGVIAALLFRRRRSE